MQQSKRHHLEKKAAAVDMGTNKSGRNQKGAGLRVCRHKGRQE